MANKTYYEIPTNFQDSISDLAFADQQRYLAATSWEGMIYVWEFNPEYLNPTVKIEYKDISKNAYLRCCFNPECNFIFFGTSHGDICHFQLDSPKGSKPNVSYQHSTGPIVGLKFCAAKSMLVALALEKNDGKILLIDFVDSVVAIQINTKPINMDISGSHLFVAAIGQIIYYLDLDKLGANPQSQVKIITTQLQYQIKSISVSRNKPDRYIVGSIYGQAEIKDGNNAHIVDCHREVNHGQIFASNSVAMVADMNCAISAGGNGTLKMINFEKPKGGRDFPFYNFPLTCIAVSSKGEVAAVAQGYDWSRGAEIYKTDRPKVALYIKKINPQEF